MPEFFYLVLSAAAGSVLAVLSLSWLKKSIHQLSSQTNPLILILSFLGRLLLCAGAFAALAYGGHMDRLIACFLGFALTHTVTVILAANQAMQKRKKGAVHDDQPGQD